MALIKNVFLLVALSWLITNASASRELPMSMKPAELDLVARLETSGGLVECWNALVELKSCTNEIILFFLNGQADIGPDCCGAIDIITRNCWPTMLTSLGFTAEEGNILRGYCDAYTPSPAAPPPAAESPVQPPSIWLEWRLGDKPLGSFIYIHTYICWKLFWVFVWFGLF